MAYDWRHRGIMARRSIRRNIISSRLKGFKTFTDTFNSLSFNTKWKLVRGTWSSNGSKATTSDSSSSYPLATVTMASPNVEIDLIADNAGHGAALWVADSGNWWSLVSHQSTCSGCGSCLTYNPYNPCGAGGNCTGTCGGGVTPGYDYYSCGWVPGNAYQSCTGGNAVGGNSNPAYYVCSMYVYNPAGFANNTCKYGTFYPSTTNYVYYNAVTCIDRANPGSYQCNYAGTYNPTPNPTYCCGYNPCIGTGGGCASYADTYPRYLKLLKYTANTVSEIASVTLDSLTSFTPIAAIKVKITNADKAAGTATVTASAFSDTNMVTKIGDDLVHNATGVTIITNYGIIASPSDYNETSLIDNIEIK